MTASEGMGKQERGVRGGGGGGGSTPLDFVTADYSLIAEGGLRSG